MKKYVFLLAFIYTILALVILNYSNIINTITYENRIKKVNIHNDSIRNILSRDSVIHNIIRSNHPSIALSFDEKCNCKQIDFLDSASNQICEVMLDSFRSEESLQEDSFLIHIIQSVKTKINPTINLYEHNYIRNYNSKNSTVKNFRLSETEMVKSIFSDVLYIDNDSISAINLTPHGEVSMIYSSRDGSNYLVNQFFNGSCSTGFLSSKKIPIVATSHDYLLSDDSWRLLPVPSPYSICNYTNSFEKICTIIFFAIIAIIVIFTISLFLWIESKRDEIRDIIRWFRKSVYRTYFIDDDKVEDYNHIPLDNSILFNLYQKGILKRNYFEWKEMELKEDCISLSEKYAVGAKRFIGMCSKDSKWKSLCGNNIDLYSMCNAYRKDPHGGLFIDNFFDDMKQHIVLEQWEYEQEEFTTKYREKFKGHNISLGLDNIYCYGGNSIMLWPSTSGSYNVCCISLHSYSSERILGENYVSTFCRNYSLFKDGNLWHWNHNASLHELLKCIDLIIETNKECQNLDVTFIISKHNSYSKETIEFIENIKAYLKNKHINILSSDKMSSASGLILYFDASMIDVDIYHEVGNLVANGIDYNKRNPRLYERKEDKHYDFKHQFQIIYISLFYDWKDSMKQLVYDKIKDEDNNQIDEVKIKSEVENTGFKLMADWVYLDTTEKYFKSIILLIKQCGYDWRSVVKLKIKGPITGQNIKDLQKLAGFNFQSCSFDNSYFGGLYQGGNMTALDLSEAYISDNSVYGDPISDVEIVSNEVVSDTLSDWFIDAPKLKHLVLPYGIKTIESIPSVENLYALDNNSLLDDSIWKENGLSKPLIHSFVPSTIGKIDKIDINVDKCLMEEGQWGSMYFNSLYYTYGLGTYTKNKKISNIRIPELIANFEFDQTSGIYDLNDHTTLFSVFQYNEDLKYKDLLYKAENGKFEIVSKEYKKCFEFIDSLNKNCHLIVIIDYNNHLNWSKEVINIYYSPILNHLKENNITYTYTYSEDNVSDYNYVLHLYPNGIYNDLITLLEKDNYINAPKRVIAILTLMCKMPDVEISDFHQPYETYKNFVELDINDKIENKSLTEILLSQQISMKSITKLKLSGIVTSETIRDIRCMIKDGNLTELDMSGISLRELPLVDEEDPNIENAYYIYTYSGYKFSEYFTTCEYIKTDTLDNWFFDCEKLESIVLPSSIKHVVDVPNCKLYALYGAPISNINSEVWQDYSKSKDICINIIYGNKYCDNSFSIEQRDVVNLSSGHHLVLAPPGCGKTRVLAGRVVHAIEEGVNTEDMLCLTFTNRAARNMQEAIGKRVEKENVDNLFVGNVHHFCSHVLRQYKVISQRSTIIDDEEKDVILRGIVQKVCYRDIKDVESYYNFQHYLHQIEHGHPADLIVRPEMQKYVDDAVYSQVVREYVSYKKRYDLLDFEDLLLMGYDFLCSHQNEIKKYKWIQVDEVQDLNHLQIAIIDLVTSAENPCVIYLGDEQQAIYSFMGAKLSTLERLKDVCKGNIHHFHGNYRSPQYLLDVFNEFAVQNLHVSRELLPDAKGEKAKLTKESDSLLLESCELKEGFSKVDYCSYDMAAERATLYTEGRTAILANSNKDVDAISERLTKKGVEHFKISGEDFLWSKEVKLMFAHLSVFTQPENLMSWARILMGVGVVPSLEKAHEFIANANDAYLLGNDLINEKRNTVIKDFVRDYPGEFVIFDTETTGLDVNNDDIVEISALKISGGCIVEEYDIMLATNKLIPEMLGDIKNPLPEVYAQREKLSRREGLAGFLKWVGDTPILAHNAKYDIQILDANLKRDCGITDLKSRWTRIHDSLNLARIVESDLNSYKLKDLLTQFGLQGVNSHLAIDDVKATKSLVDYLFQKASPIFIKQNDFFVKNASVIGILRNKYGELYRHTESLLDTVFNENNILVSELAFAYKYFIDKGIFGKLDKMEYLMEFLKEDFIKDYRGKNLSQLLNEYMIPLTTLREADLCDGESLKNRIKIFVSTIHRAKGLEFDNVVIFGVQDGLFPYYLDTKTIRESNNPIEIAKAKQGVDESARKLYVAISRAKKRLCIQFPRNNSGYGQNGWYCHPTNISSFINCISHYFNKKSD